MSKGLILGGDFPAAAWLAVALAHRGWRVAWAEQVAASGWWGIGHALMTWLGEPLPNWPLDVCVNALDGVAWFQQNRLIDLQAWPGAVIDRAAFARVMEAERQDLPRESRLNLAAPAARLGAFSADWCLLFDFCPGGCDSPRLGGEFELTMPGGMLEVYTGASGTLALAGWEPGRTVFEFSGRDTAALNQSLQTVLARAPRPSPSCACLPRLERQGRLLRLILPVAGLMPESQLRQSLGWLAAQALLRWLSEDLLILDRLGDHLEAYLAKILQGLNRVRNSYTFLENPP